jgi:hypothetical protein
MSGNIQYGTVCLNCYKVVWDRTETEARARLLKHLVNYHKYNSKQADEYAKSAPLRRNENG